MFKEFAKIVMLKIITVKHASLKNNVFNVSKIHLMIQKKNIVLKNAMNSIIVIQFNALNANSHA